MGSLWGTCTLQLLVMSLPSFEEKQRGGCGRERVSEIKKWEVLRHLLSIKTQGKKKNPPKGVLQSATVTGFLLWEVHSTDDGGHASNHWGVGGWVLGVVRWAISYQGFIILSGYVECWM